MAKLQQQLTPTNGGMPALQTIGTVTITVIGTPTISALCKGDACVSTTGATLVDAIGDCNGYSARIKAGTNWIAFTEQAPCATIDFSPSVFGPQSLINRAQITGNWQLMDAATGNYQLLSHSGDCDLSHEKVYDRFLGTTYSFDIPSPCAIIDYSGHDTATLQIVNYLLSRGVKLKSDGTVSSSADHNANPANALTALEAALQSLLAQLGR